MEERLGCPQFGLMRRGVSLWLIVLFGLNGCGYFAARALQGDEAVVPDSFEFVGDKAPCYLELQRAEKALRMNCFHIDGVLHIHSSRWANLPRISGESWSVTIRKHPRVRVEIADKIYTMRAVAIDDETLRQDILDARGYWVAWDAITVFQFFSDRR